MSLYQFGRKGNVEAFLKEQANPAGTRRELEQFYDSTEEVQGFRVNREFLITPVHVMRTENVVWVYLAKVKETYMGVLPWPSSYHIQLYTQTGKLYDIRAAKKEAAHDLMKYLFDKIPHAYFLDYTQVPESDELRERWRTEKNYWWFRKQGIQQHGKR